MDIAKLTDVVRGVLESQVHINLEVVPQRDELAARVAEAVAAAFPIEGKDPEKETQQ